MATITIDDELLSATTMRAAEEARDLDYISTPFLQELERVHGKGQPNKTTGARWIGSFGAGSHSNPTRQSSGYERLDLNFGGTLKPMVLTPDEVIFPVGLSLVEEELNGGADSTIGFAAQRTQKVMGEAKRRFEKYMFQGALSADVAEFGGFYHLNGLDDADLGVLEENAAGAQSNAIGGFDKGSYLTVEGAQNQAYNIGGSFQAGGLTGLIDSIIKAEQRSEGGLAGLAVFGSNNAVRNYRMLLQPQERYAQNDKSVNGMRVAPLMVHNAPLHVSAYMPQSGAISATSKVSFYIVDLNAIYFCWSKVVRDGFFGLGDWKDVGNGYNVKINQIVIRGQLFVEAWGGSAVLYNGETF